jgi:hypothetical protein
MGWSLANEQRRSFEIVFKRVFPVYFYGVIFALLLSSIYIFTKNDIAESNYMPFFLGVNVFFDFFPANPTTWYLGTYLHILLFWFCFLRGKQITGKHVVLAVVCEIIIRAAILSFDKEFIAYMTLPNWLSVFILGGYLCKKTDTSWTKGSALLVASWAVFLAFWVIYGKHIVGTTSFPFRDLAYNDYSNVVVPSFIRSMLITFFYISSTYVFFTLLRRLPASKIVGFFARNSLITFIVHMPLIYGFAQPYYALFPEKSMGQITFIFVIFIGCACLSEVLSKIIKVSFFQKHAWRLFTAIFGRYIVKAEIK